MDFNILTLIIFIPLIGAIILALVPKKVEKSAKYISLVTSLVILGLAVYLWIIFDPSVPTMQFGEKYQWIANVNVYYHLGVDGISMPMVFLTALLSVLGVLVYWNSTN